MFIIFGSKTVKTPVKDGLNLRKHCGRCRLLSDMQEHSSKQYFTLFFIPVFPISKGESSLVCTRCGASFYIQSEDHLRSQTESPFHTAGAVNKSSESDSEKMVVDRRARRRGLEFCSGSTPLRAS